jgi:hypothetical protein
MATSGIVATYYPVGVLSDGGDFGEKFFVGGPLPIGLPKKLIEFRVRNPKVLCQFGS